MTVFDQRGQHVTYQYNAAGDINFGMVQNKADLLGQLEALQAELARAVEQGVIEDEEVALDTETYLKKTIIQAKKPQPDKKKLVDHLNGAKALLGGITAAAGMVGALAKAAELVQKLF
jgi:hypothetical protein